ncbi:hypothetical protein [Marinobacter xestospongiae]|uniref:Uncharacterized protein n=1 Tax=Marinobacter xestospongiae TaxID=994319 RepID=A0ABU3VVA1_9GAMM|nr:hypothetical protein [Marinobacter xestospongiae]MDV2078207.1 hypothetical protein [Marinobacter xestospongiae]
MHTPISLRSLLGTGGLALTLTLAGCGSSDDSTPLKPGQDARLVGVVSTVASDFTSGAVELIDMSETDPVASGAYFPTGSDIGVTARGQHYYRFGRFNIDTLQKVDVANPAQEIWQFSTLSAGDTASSNPYALVFVNDTKAYLLRYNTSEAWIVNPSATSEDEFFSGETLDLSGYLPDNTQGAPNMASGVVVDGKLFITLQRLDSEYDPTNTAYVAVFDTDTDTEIDTGMGENGLKGIPLIGRNPGGIQYHEDLGILVKNTGSYDTKEQTGVDRIDPETFAIEPLIADADTDDLLSDLVIVSDTQGYVLSYAGWKDTTLQSFNPSAATIEFTTVASYAGGDYRDIELSPEGNLWLADATANNPGVRILATADNSEQAFIQTTLLPTGVAFTEIDDE